MQNKLLSPLGAFSHHRKSEAGAMPEREITFWKLEVMDNAFRFYLPDNKVDWAIEHDHLISGNVYKAHSPVDMLKMLDILEGMSPDFTHIEIQERILLMRKRLYSPGIFLNVHTRNTLFFEDLHLKSLNFLDFYKEHIHNNSEAYNQRDSGKTHNNSMGYGNDLIN